MNRSKLICRQRRYGLLYYLFSFTWIVYFISRFLFGDSLAGVALLSNCLPVALIPALLLPFVGYRRKDSFLFITGAGLTAFLLLEYGVRFVLRPAITRRNGVTSLRILTHNTGQDLPTYLSRIALIENTDADLVLLQEITEEFAVGFLPRLEEIYPFQSISPMKSDRDQRIGLGVLSKTPILESSSFKLVEQGVMFQQRIVLDFHGEPIVVYNIHTTFPWFRPTSRKAVREFVPQTYDDTVRRREVSELARLVRQEVSPLILGGDFNFNDQSSDYSALTGIGLVDAYRQVGIGMGFTWPANRTPSINIRPAIPMLRLDYVFHSPDLITIKAMVGAKTGSDHKPLYVELGLH